MNHSKQKKGARPSKRIARAKMPLNLIGPEVRKWRIKKEWSQERLAIWLQLRGWSISRNSVARLESQRRRVPDCELFFIVRALEIPLGALFPENMPLKTIAAQFQPRPRMVPATVRRKK